MSEIRVFPDSRALANAAAEYFVNTARDSIAERGRFTVSLSGGNTPRALYALLATEFFAKQVDWARVHIFWGDERCVPPDHAESDYLMARESLLDFVPIPSTQIYRIQAENDPVQAAADYEALLKAFFPNTPNFDLLLLGMGDDGHTASLFPHTTALHEKQRWVIENYVDKLGVWRVTLTLPALNAARRVLFLVSGDAKAEPLRKVLQGIYQPDEFPSQSIKPLSGHLIWMVDAAAAALL